MSTATARVRGSLVTRSLLLSASVLLLLGPAVAVAQNVAQNVAYHGKLQIGFNDQDNIIPGFPTNNAIPLCAGAGPLVNTALVGTTLGTLWVNALGSAVPGVGGALTFNAVGGGAGGAQQKNQVTCKVAAPGGGNIRLRSRTQVASANFPGRKGAYTTMITQAAVPTNPTATYMLSMSGGNTQSAPTITWTTMATQSASAMTFSGPALSATIPFYGTAGGVARIQPGPNRFGGGLPYSGSGGVQLGIHLSSMVGPTQTYGHFLYANGFLGQGPQFFGTDAKGIHVPNPITATIYSSNISFTLGLIAGRQNLYTYAARTPGGSTIDQQGAVRTTLGGNTVTPHPSCPDPITCGAPIVSPIAASGAFFEWTTGAVTHTDMVGDFTTIRKASGYDVAVAPSTAVAGETRRIQVVSPWSSAIRPVGPFGLPVPSLGLGGVAVLTINVMPLLEDQDADLVADTVDNCLDVPNGPNEQSNQIDTDQDGYGNACDVDYNNDGLTTTIDYAPFINAFVSGAMNTETDHNGDGFTTTLDFPAYLDAFTGLDPLGPSGLACAGGTPPCLP